MVDGGIAQPMIMIMIILMMKLVRSLLLLYSVVKGSSPYHLSSSLFRRQCIIGFFLQQSIYQQYQDQQQQQQQLMHWSTRSTGGIFNGSWSMEFLGKYHQHHRFIEQSVESSVITRFYRDYWFCSRVKSMAGWSMSFPFDLLILWFWIPRLLIRVIASTHAHFNARDQFTALSPQLPLYFSLWINFK